MALNRDEVGEDANPEGPTEEQSRLTFSLFRRPEKYRIGEDFSLFIKKLNLYFEAIGLTDNKQRRYVLLFNLSEDAFRLAESIDLPESNDWETFVDCLKTLFERNQTGTEKRYSFHKRVQQPDESVDSFALTLRELGSKCGFNGEEYNHHLVDQFILGLRDRSTQNKLLQEPPVDLDAALFVARRFGAANSTMKKLKVEHFEASQSVRSVGSRTASKVCFSCNGYGHVSRECPTRRKAVSGRSSAKNFNVVCYNCKQSGHLARNCLTHNPSHDKQVLNGKFAEPQFERKTIVCFNCGEIGHISRVCPRKEPRLARGQNSASSSLRFTNSEHVSNDTRVRLSSVSPASKRKTLVLETNLNGIPRFCIVDTGASVSLISKDEWELLTKETRTSLLPSDIVAEAANNSPIGVVGKSVLSIDIDGKQQFQQTFYVANDISNEIILGLDWLTNCHCVIDTPKLLIEFPDGSKAPLLLNDSSIPDPAAVILCDDTEIPGRHEVIRRAKVKGVFLAESIVEPNVSLAEKGILVARTFVSPNRQTVPVQIINPGEDTIKLYGGTNIGHLEHVAMDDPVLFDNQKANCSEPRFDLNHLQENERVRVERLLYDYKTIFANNIFELGATSFTEHSINTGNAQPIKQLPRRLPNTLRAVVDQQVKEMIDSNIVRPSQSPWASPIVLVRKKDSTWRFCIDYRKLNDVTVKDSYMIPQVNDRLDTLAGQTYFTTLSPVHTS